MNIAAKRNDDSSSNETAYAFECAEHYISGFTKLHNFQQSRMFCDVTVMVGRQKYLAHKVVLAAVSPYFADVLQGEDQSQTNQVVEIDLGATCPLSFQLVLEFIYSGKVMITIENIRDLVLTSKTLQIASLEAACRDAIEVLLSPANWFLLKTVAGAQYSEDSYRKCLSYALQHFKEIAETEAFLQLTIDEVKELVEDGEVSVVSEEKYSAVMKWVKHDLIDRKENLFELMKAVELPLMDHTFFMENVFVENLLRLDLECMSLVLDSTKCHMVVQSGSESSSSTPDPRKHSKNAFATYIFVAGGHNGSSMSDCEVYNSKTNTWHAIASMQRKRHQTAVIGFDQYLYAFGGWDGHERLSSAEYYDTLKNTWDWTTPLPHERSNHAICSLNGAVYICGGKNKDGQLLSSVEQFDVPTARYKTSAAMNTERAGFETAVTGDCIYAIGGWNGSKLDSVERFDPREGKWSPAPSMRTKRVDHGVTVLNDYIYCTGGEGSERSGERFDTRRNVWDTIPDMLDERKGLELVTLTGCIYAVGGSRNSVEKLDPNTNRWIQIPSPMLKARSYFGASVLDCLEIKHL